MIKIDIAVAKRIIDNRLLNLNLPPTDLFAIKKVLKKLYLK